MKNGDTPINPLYGQSNALFVKGGVDADWIEKAGPLMGLTKREYFAIMILQGILASSPSGYRNPSVSAVEAVHAADIFLNKLEEK